MAREYVSLDQSIKVLREALIRNFPGVKFSIRRGRGTGYSTVRVSWERGPSARMVDRIAQRFHGRDFDGMTDSNSYPSALLADAQGNVREVNFGAGFIFCDRGLPDGTREAVQEAFAAFYNCEDWRSRQSSDHWAGDALADYVCPPAIGPQEIAVQVLAQYRAAQDARLAR